MHAQKAFIIDKLDQKADLVHVGGQHDARPAAAFFDSDDAAQGVNSDFVGQRLQLAHDKVAHGLFAPRNARRLAEAFEKVVVKWHRSLFCF